jgi:Tfp pilus assembly protein PilV
MNKRIGFIWFKFLGFNGLRNIKAISLIELLISIMVVGIMFLSFFGLETFSYKQILSADRRTKVQNSLAYCLEHMSKYVQQANGNFSRNAIQYYGTTGFSVYVDLVTAGHTFNDTSDDSEIRYTLSGNTLTATCTPHDGFSSCSSIITGTLSDKIISGVAINTTIPDTGDPYNSPYTGPTSGFYINIGTATDSLGTFVDIGLVGRYYPNVTPTEGTRLTNPQVAMKTRLICNNSSTN